MGTGTVSADSHVALEHERVREHLAGRFHEAYDEAAAEHARRVAAGKAASNLGEHWYRPGHFDGAAHLEDMDVDGLDAEVIYCEVSGFRGAHPGRQRSPGPGADVSAPTARGCAGEQRRADVVAVPAVLSSGGGGR